MVRLAGGRHSYREECYGAFGDNHLRLPLSNQTAHLLAHAQHSARAFGSRIASWADFQENTEENILHAPL